jgi:hypothetical protein
MDISSDAELQQIFEKRFRRLGRCVPNDTDYAKGLCSMAQVMSSLLGLDFEPAYFGTVINDAPNVFFVRDQDAYFFAMTSALYINIDSSIEVGLRKLLSERLVHRSAIEEIQLILNHYAYLFLLGHQCGHIALGHADRELAINEPAGETNTSRTFLQEAHADVVGACAMMSNKRGLRRMVNLTNGPTALALLQLPVLSVLAGLKPALAKVSLFARLRNSTANVDRDAGYVQLFARILCAGRFLFDWMSILEVSTFKESNEQLAEAERKTIAGTIDAAQSVATIIIDAVSPQISSLVKTKPKEVREGYIELQAATKPAFEQWTRKGLWLACDTPEFEASARHGEVTEVSPVNQKVESKDLYQLEAPPSGNYNRQEQTIPLRVRTEDELREAFKTRFSKVGGCLNDAGAWERALCHLAQSMTLILGVEQEAEAIYCGIVTSYDANAYVVKDQGTYFIGISAGITTLVSNSIGAALGKLAAKALINRSIIEELQTILHLHAMLFVLGHECGHIAFGHVDRELALAEMAGETNMSSTYLEKAHADLIGAFAMMAFKRNLYRICQLTNAATAVGLLQLPVVCVLSEFKNAAAKVKKGIGYPHPIVRLMCIGHILISWSTPILFETLPGFDDFSRKQEQIAEAQNLAGQFLTHIFEAVAPEMHAHLVIDAKELGQATRELMAATKPTLEKWLNKGLWLVWDTPEFEARNHQTS